MIDNVQALIIRGLDTRYKIRNRGELKAIVHSRHKQLNWSLSPKGQGLHYLYERARPWGTLGVGFVHANQEGIQKQGNQNNRVMEGGEHGLRALYARR